MFTILVELASNMGIFSMDQAGRSRKSVNVAEHPGPITGGFLDAGVEFISSCPK